MTGKEFLYISEAHRNGRLGGDGPFTNRCQEWLERELGVKKALLTHSCTAALEMAAILCDIGPGDEVIVPSYTFVSTANAFVLRGGVPVFVDVRPDNFNIDEHLIEAAITPRTRAIVPVHYAGVACEMDAIMGIARKHNLLVVEDAAQAIMATYKGRFLGSIGHLGALSFHETKNIISGEGGALLINDSRFVERAEIIREKGTDRSKFFRGQVDKYSWVDIGSSYLPGELTAAFLWAQMEEASKITDERMKIWRGYYDRLSPLEARGLLKLPRHPNDCGQNGHMFYILLSDLDVRTRLIDRLLQASIYSVFHYVPLHSSPYGKRHGRSVGELTNTIVASDRLLRLPFWIGMGDKLDHIAEELQKALLKS